MNLEQIRLDFDNGKLTKPEYIHEMYGIHQKIFQYAEWLKKTDIHKIEISDGNIIATTKYKNASYEGSGPKFYVDDHDERIAPVEILNFFSYEPDEYNMICKLISDNQVIFDIGANIGFISLHLAHQYPKGQLYSFEPIPKTYNYLSRNISINKSENINTFNFGLSTQTEDKTFYYYPEGSGNASLANLSEKENVESVEVHVKKLDDAWIEYNWPNIDFIKCDVEGAELLVFQGGKETIEKCRPIIFSEILRKWSKKFDYHPNDIINFFKEMDYICFVTHQGFLEEFDLVTEETEETNFFFLHQDKHQNLIKEHKRG